MYEIITLKRKMNVRAKVNDIQRTLPLNKVLINMRLLIVSICSRSLWVSMQETQEPYIGKFVSQTNSHSTRKCSVTVIHVKGSYFALGTSCIR
jgi:hypothetical protein